MFIFQIQIIIIMELILEQPPQGMKLIQTEIIEPPE